MIDHISVFVANLDASKRFYEAALAPLGYTAHKRFPGVAGLGVAPEADFWLVERPTADGGHHIAFRARSRAEVDAFYVAALAAGAKDNGAPGPRPQYHATYYGAFAFDPDGNNVEAVCHDPA